eukprot:CAMPEP_0206048612 /NCGR_PEP_ID=MMETSP1466-20131121/24588_1 /ASSEMBLY_ACC=CAM_ASM_001126 /TAXON_ID=44452 /ORGANISM="Pavlova gyrans, Strain CCMP608" /LENGTH=123 /DNA_ID=CAMNT_0053423677 /DNA_START=165 /DNA_END=536 /DNA_ORIENTATION=+
MGVRGEECLFAHEQVDRLILRERTRRAEPKVDHAQSIGPSVSQHHVARCEVTVNDVVIVQPRNNAANGLYKLLNILAVARPFLRRVAKKAFHGLTRNEFHHQRAADHVHKVHGRDLHFHLAGA